MNILEQARGIIYEKSEEKERQYGDFFENMEDAAKIASVMSKKEFTAEDIYHALIGLKFARESHTHKHDNMLDAIAYLASLHEYRESKLNEITQEKINDIEVVNAFEFLSDKKKQWIDSKNIKKQKNGHGRNFTIDEEDDEEPLDWKDLLHFKMLEEDASKDPFIGFTTTLA